MRAEAQSFRVEMSQEFALVRAEAQSFRIEMGQEFALVRSQIRESEQRTLATLHRELASSTRTMIVAMVGTMLTTSSLAFVAASQVG